MAANAVEAVESRTARVARRAAITKSRRLHAGPRVPRSTPREPHHRTCLRGALLVRQ